MNILQQLSNQNLIDKIGVMVIAFDEQGRISMINAAGCELLGYEHDELIGMDWCSHFLPYQDQETISLYMRQIISGETDLVAEHENPIITRTGAKRIIHWQNNVLRDSDNVITGILSTGEDITTRKQAEENVHRNEQRYRRFVEHIPDIMFIYDERGRIVDANTQACRSLGYSREELLSLNVFDIDLELPANRIDELIQEIIQTRGPRIIKGFYRCKDGHTFPAQIKVDSFERNKSPLLISVVRDLREQLDQQKKLQDHQDLLRIIINSIPDIICIKDGDGRWLLANTYDLELFGLDAIAYQGKTDAELAPYTPFYKDTFTCCMESDETAWESRQLRRATEVIHMPSGQSRIFDVYKIPIFNDDGTRNALVVIGRDITEQKKVEDKYRRLFERSPMAYFSSSPSGEIRDVNRAGSDLIGCLPDEIIGKNLMDFMTPESRKLFSRHYPEFLCGEEFSGTDYEIVKADGSCIRTQITAAIVNDDAGEPVAVQCIVVDITRQREVEEMIRASEARYRLLFDRAPVGILHFDTDLHVTSCNANYLQLMEVTQAQILGFDVKDLRDKRVLPALQKALTGEEGWWEGEYRATLTQKTAFISLRTAPLYDGQGNIQGGMAIVVDRSRQKEAEMERTRLMSAIDQAAETLVITNTRGIIKYVNPAFEKITGYSAEEAQGQNPSVLQSGIHGKDFYKDMWKTLSTGLVWKGHIVNKRKNGTLFEEDVTISPVRNQEGKIINYVAVKRDITREAALEKQLNQAMKMEAIGTLAGGIAHDFNNILSAILGYAEMVKLQLAGNNPARKDVSHIILAGNRAADLIKQILTFSRQEEKELRAVKLQFVVKEAFKLLRSSLPTSIDLQQEINHTCGSVLADPVRIHQVMMNLCTNAKQAMGTEQGKLRVGLSEIDQHAAMDNLPPPVHSGRWLDLMVSDTGSGIDSSIIEKIFDPFFTTKEKSEGTGLGLSVVHGIVKSHGGEITVSSEPDQGTTFHVYLPIIDQGQEEECSSVELAPLPRGNERILLVDDEPLLVDIMKRMLMDLGYLVDSFTDSRETMKWFNAQGEDIDLVLTDMTMPHMNGAELAEKVLEKNPNMPIILCSGYSESIDVNKAKSLGIMEYIAKPVDRRLLAETVRTALDKSGWQNRNHDKQGLW